MKSRESLDPVNGYKILYKGLFRILIIQYVTFAERIIILLFTENADTGIFGK